MSHEDTEPVVRIVSDGTGAGTKVYVDGHLMKCATCVEWSVDAKGIAKATVIMHRIGVELSANERELELTGLSYPESLARAKDTIQDAA